MPIALHLTQLKKQWTACVLYACKTFQSYAQYIGKNQQENIDTIFTRAMIESKKEAKNKQRKYVKGFVIIYSEEDMYSFFESVASAFNVSIGLRDTEERMVITPMTNTHFLHCTLTFSSLDLSADKKSVSHVLSFDCEHDCLSADILQNENTPDFLLEAMSCSSSKEMLMEENESVTSRDQTPSHNNSHFSTPLPQSDDVPLSGTTITIPEEQPCEDITIQSITRETITTPPELKEPTTRENTQQQHEPAACPSKLLSTLKMLKAKEVENISKEIEYNPTCASSLTVEQEERLQDALELIGVKQEKNDGLTLIKSMIEKLSPQLPNQNHSVPQPECASQSPFLCSTSFDNKKNSSQAPTAQIQATRKRKRTLSESSFSSADNNKRHCESPCSSSSSDCSSNEEEEEVVSNKQQLKLHGFSIPGGDAGSFRNFLKKSDEKNYDHTLEVFSENIKKAHDIFAVVMRWINSLLTMVSDIPFELDPKTGSPVITCKCCGLHCPAKIRISSRKGRPKKASFAKFNKRNEKKTTPPTKEK